MSARYGEEYRQERIRIVSSTIDQVVGIIENMSVMEL